MVTPIDAVRSGMGFDPSGRWHEAKAPYLPAHRRASDIDPNATARGAALGILIGGVMWVGILVALRALLHAL
jgi:hypothetical protein